MLYMDPMQQVNNGVSKIIAQSESLLLSLSGGSISCNSFPEFEKLDVLDVDQILDFEIYKNRSQKYIQYFLAVLLKSRVLKIFVFDRVRKHYRYVTKVSLQQGDNLPIFDGGIAVQKDIFVIQYQQSAEYIKIHNKGHPNDETITRLMLWNNEPVQAAKK